MEELIRNFSIIALGGILTLELLLGGFIIGIILGTILAILRFKNIGRIFINSLVSVLRGTPLILQLSFVYFLSPVIIGLKLSFISAGIITFGLNSSAYIAEIIKAGIETIPKGQFEAGKTLQIPDYYLYKDIIIPQVIRNIFPALINETISLLKETALISTIGGMDIMRKAQIVSAQEFSYFIPLSIAGFCYYMLVLLIEYGGRKIERKIYVKNK